MKRLYKNWTFHNLVSHPLSEVVWLLTRSEKLSGWIHDCSIPDHVPGTGRG